MAIKTKIIVQQILNIDDTTTTASKYPKYTVVLGNSISSITAGELTAAVETAAGSAAAAKGSEIAAKDSENKAKDSEIQAGIHAGASEASATQSAASATESEKQANLSQSSAENSAASALESKNFKDAAELAAQNAEQSKTLAEQAQRAAEAAQSGAQASENRASAFATQAAASSASAGDFAAAAKQSELNAKTSETNAASSATEAGDKAIDATTEADRAKAEADRATQIVDSKLDKVDISGFIKVYKTKAEADADVGSRVLGEKILVWNQTDSKYGWYKVAGTAEAPVLELVEVEQKLVSINNVHADDAGNVQITLPGGNPSLWLGEVTWFPYDKDSGVGYPGVLPADGREVLRVDYPDTWEAIEAGLIPSVSEAEWQAGATLYFSTGDGSTTFRLPDMMQGQAFRAAAKGEENAGNIKEQIPYITSVNGVLPEDATGAIVIGLSSVEGTLPIAKGGTGATTKEAARTALEVPAASDVYTKAETYEKSELYTQNEVDDKLVGVKTQADTSYLAKTQNLSDLADRAAAWINVRPVGSTPLAGDPVNALDATTKRWVEASINSKMTEHIAGLNVSVTGTDITVYPGECYIPSEASVLRLTAPKTIAHSGLTAATKYYIYAYNDNGSLGIEVSTTENVKYGYKASNKQSDTSRRFIGMFYFTGGSEVAACRLIDGECIHLFHWGGIGRVLNKGTATTDAPVNYEKFVPLAAFTSVKLAVTNTTTTTTAADIASVGLPYITNVQPNYCKYLIDMLPSSSGGGVVAYKYNNGAPQDGGGFFIDVAGYKYDR